MAINRAGANFQAKIDAANFAKTRTVDAKQGSVAAQNSGAVAQKSKDTKPKGPSEGSTLSEAAQKALEQKSLQDDIKQAQAGLADEASQANGKTKTKDKDDKKNIGHGRIEQKESTRVFQLDDDDERSYEVPEKVGAKLDSLDRKTPEQILQGMPEASRIAAGAMVATQGPVKLAKELKDDPKVTAKVEQMDLDPADPEWREHTLAPIKSPKDEPPLQMDDPHAEGMAKEAAVRQMQAGGGEQLIA